jgi:hypothetical protein
MPAVGQLCTVMETMQQHPVPRKFRISRFLRRLSIVIATILIGWTLLTLWVEREGNPVMEILGAPDHHPHALIVYDPDPFYNLDYRVCRTFGQVLADSGWAVTIATVAAARNHRLPPPHVFIFCANTYNWAPDRAVSQYIRRDAPIAGKNTVAITIGSGSTERSKRLMEEQIRARNGRLIASRSFWLLRPNDETRLEEPNMEVACAQIRVWAQELTAALRQ